MNRARVLLDWLIVHRCLARKKRREKGKRLPANGQAHNPEISEVLHASLGSTSTPYH